MLNELDSRLREEDMRNGALILLIVTGFGLLGLPARAQEDLLDIGDDSEQSEQEQPEADTDDANEDPNDPTSIETSDLDASTIDEDESEEEELTDSDETQATTPSSPVLPRASVDPARLDKIKAVPRKAVLKKGRLELAPLASLSMNDAYYQHLAVGGTLVYFPHDSFGFGVGADYLYENLETSNVDDVRRGLISVPAVFEQPELFAHFDLYWVPIYGKVSLFDRNIFHFEFYATGGLGVAGGFDDTFNPAANMGLGQRMFFSDWLALRVEARNHIYLATQTVNDIERSDIQNILMFYVGVSFFIPPSFEYSSL